MRFSTPVLAIETLYLSCSHDHRRPMPFPRISVRLLFAAASSQPGLLQVNVELSPRSRCKEISLQLPCLMLQSGHFAAKCLTGKGLRYKSSTLTCGLRLPLTHYIEFSAFKRLVLLIGATNEDNIIPSGDESTKMSVEGCYPAKAGLLACLLAA